MTISTSDLFSPMSIGLLVWLFSWGMNRVYLTFKSLMSFFL